MSSFLSVLEQYFYFSSLIILIVGIPGNALMFFMYTSRARLRTLSFSLYFRVIALVDLFITLNWIKVFIRYRYGGYYIEDTSVLVCKLVSYTIYSAGPISSWHLAAISIDRLVAIMYPRRFLFLFKRSFQMLVSVAIFALNMIYYLPILIDFDLVQLNIDTSNQTTDLQLGTNSSQPIIYQCRMDFHLLYWLDMVNSCTLPFLFMIVITSITIRFMVKTRCRTSMVAVVVVCGGSGAGVGGVRTGSSSSGSLSRDAKFSLTSISLNVLFLVLNLPNHVFALYLALHNYDSLFDISEYSNSQQASSSSWQELVGFSCLVLFYANHAIGFYVQVAVNGVFRRETRKMFRSVLSFFAIVVVSLRPDRCRRRLRKTPLDSDLSLTSLQY